MHSIGRVFENEVDLLAGLLVKVLRYDPAERISAKEALEHDWFNFEGVSAVEGRPSWVAAKFLEYDTSRFTEEHPCYRYD